MLGRRLFTRATVLVVLIAAAGVLVPHPVGAAGGVAPPAGSVKDQESATNPDGPCLVPNTRSAFVQTFTAQRTGPLSGVVMRMASPYPRWSTVVLHEVVNEVPGAFLASSRTLIVNGQPEADYLFVFPEPALVVAGRQYAILGGFNPESGPFLCVGASYDAGTALVAVDETGEFAWSAPRPAEGAPAWDFRLITYVAVPACQDRPPAVAPAGYNLIVGSGDGDSLEGTRGSDLIYGRGGEDTISARGGSDVVCAGGGRDEVSGGDGDDVLNGNDGGDTLRGNDGNDLVNGDGGRDALNGGSGDDTLRGGAGDRDDHNGADGFDGCFDDDDSAFTRCEAFS